MPPVVGQNSVGSGPDVNFTYRRVSVGFSGIVPRCLRLVRVARNAVCDPRTRPRNTPVVIGLAAPWEFHGMFTRLLSRRIDDVSRRPVPAIPIPLPQVSPRSVSPMVCPYPVRDEFDPHGSTQGTHGPAAVRALHLVRSHDQSNLGGRCQSTFSQLSSARAPVRSSVWASVPLPPGRRRPPH